MHMVTERKKCSEIVTICALCLVLFFRDAREWGVTVMSDMVYINCGSLLPKII